MGTTENSNYTSKVRREDGRTTKWESLTKRLWKKKKAKKKNSVNWNKMK